MTLRTLMWIYELIFICSWLVIPFLALILDHFVTGVLIGVAVVAVSSTMALRLRCRVCGYPVWRRGRVWAGFVQRQCWNCHTPFSDQAAN